MYQSLTGLIVFLSTASAYSYRRRGYSSSSSNDDCWGFSSEYRDCAPRRSKSCRPVFSPRFNFCPPGCAPACPPPCPPIPPICPPGCVPVCPPIPPTPPTPGPSACAPCLLAFRNVENILVTMVPQKTALIDTSFTDLNADEAAAVTASFTALKTTLSTTVTGPLQTASVACGTSATANIQSAVTSLVNDAFDSNLVYVNAELADIMLLLLELGASLAGTVPDTDLPAALAPGQPFSVEFQQIVSSIITLMAVHIQEILPGLKSDILTAFQLGIEGALLCVKQQFATMRITGRSAIQTSMNTLKTGITTIVNDEKTVLMDALTDLNNTLADNISAALDPCLLALSLSCNDSCAVSTSTTANPAVR